MEQPVTEAQEPTTLLIKAWPDPVIDKLGFDPASGYVELCWLPILGPSAVWAIRRLTAGLRANPDGYSIRIADLGSALGLGAGNGRNSLVMRTVRRLVQFHMARDDGEGVLAVRLHLPPLTQRQVMRLAPALRRAHAQLSGRGPDENPGPRAA